MHYHVSWSPHINTLCITTFPGPPYIIDQTQGGGGGGGKPELPHSLVSSYIAQTHGGEETCINTFPGLLLHFGPKTGWERTCITTFPGLLYNQLRGQC